MLHPDPESLSVEPELVVSTLGFEDDLALSSDEMQCTGGAVPDGDTVAEGEVMLWRDDGTLGETKGVVNPGMGISMHDPGEVRLWLLDRPDRSQGDSEGESHSIGERDEASLAGESSLEGESDAKWEGTTASEEGGVGREAVASRALPTLNSFMAAIRSARLNFRASFHCINQDEQQNHNISDELYFPK